MNSDTSDQNGKPASAKIVPNSKQHTTAGPYSPVLEIKMSSLVVISGQAALDLDGNVVSDDIQGQTRVTLENCLTQLKSAGCDFSHVFKVNAYLTDLDNWPAFNEIYREMMPEPRPVRTAVQTALLDTFLVELEMWAAKP